MTINAKALAPQETEEDDLGRRQVVREEIVVNLNVLLDLVVQALRSRASQHPQDSEPLDPEAFRTRVLSFAHDRPTGNILPERNIRRRLNPE